MNISKRTKMLGAVLLIALGIVLSVAAAPMAARYRGGINASEDSWIRGSYDIIWYNSQNVNSTNETIRVDGAGHVVVAGPTAAPTATPAVLIDTAGVNAGLEVQVNSTPVAAFVSNGVAWGLQSETVAAGFVITPTQRYIVLSSGSAVTSSTSTPVITSTARVGQEIVLHNSNASDAITIDGTGGTVECGANVALGADDMLTLIYNATDLVWHCSAYRDNSP